MKYILLSLIILGGLWITPAHAGLSDWTDDFEYSVGDLNGQGGWVANDTDIDINTGYNSSGLLGVRMVGDAPTQDYFYKDTNYSLASTGLSYILDFDFKVSDLTEAVHFWPSQNNTTNEDFAPCNVSVLDNDITVYSDTGGSASFEQTLVAGNWYKVQLYLNYSNNTCKARIEGYSWTSSITMNNRSGVEYVVFYSSQSIGKSIYYDNLRLYSADLINENDTRIISVTPFDEQVVSTTTIQYIGYNVYINDDYDSSKIDFRINRLNSLQDYGFGNEFFEYSTTTTQNGYINYSTLAPSVFTAGNYVLEVSITPSTVFSIFEPVTVSTSTIFYAGAATQFGLDYKAGQDEITDFFTEISATTSTSTLSSACDFMSEFNEHMPSWIGGGSPSTWDFSKCVYSIFLPNQAQVNALWIQARDGVLNRAPWGYLVTIADMFRLGTTTSESIPDINVTLPQGVAKAGTNINLEIIDNVFGESAPLNTMLSTTSATHPVAMGFIDEVEPYWDALLYTILSLYILRSLIRFGTSVGFFGEEFRPASSSFMTTTVNNQGQTRTNFTTRTKL